MTPTFGQVIRTARVSIGYTQRELAALVEIDFTYLSKIESKILFPGSSAMDAFQAYTPN